MKEYVELDSLKSFDPFHFSMISSQKNRTEMLKNAKMAQSLSGGNIGLLFLID